MKAAKRKRLIIASVALLAAMGLACVPLPVRPRDSDKEFVVSHALKSLLSERRAWTRDHWHGIGWRPLPDAGAVKNDGRLYFLNELGIPDDVFLRWGLKPIPEGKKLDVDGGDFLVRFSYRDIEGNPTGRIQFSYHFGTVGAQGYEIKFARSLLFRYVFYDHRWVS